MARMLTEAPVESDAFHFCEQRAAGRSEVRQADPNILINENDRKMSCDPFASFV
jgi:hypothetical protein